MVTTELFPGRLVVATPDLKDPHFERTVVLVVAHERHGTLGVILNRATEVPVSEVLRPWAGLAGDPPVLFEGGPVQPDSAICLALAVALPGSGTEWPGTEWPETDRPGTEWPGTDRPGTGFPEWEIPGVEAQGAEFPGAGFGGAELPNSGLPGAYFPGAELPGWTRVIGALGTVDLSGNPEALGPGVGQLRVFAGYAGWDAGQLEAEVAEGSWLVFDALPGDAFVEQPDDLWAMVLRRQGGLTAAVAAFPPDPSLN
jgi:putative transcriptional regulator